MRKSMTVLKSIYGTLRHAKPRARVDLYALYTNLLFRYLPN